MKINIKTKYNPQGEYQVVCRGRYHDGSPALEIFTSEGEVQSKATVCVPGHVPTGDNVMIKDWSENEGILDALIGAGVIEKPVAEIQCNFVTAFECPLTEAGKTIL